MQVGDKVEILVKTVSFSRKVFVCVHIKHTATYATALSPAVACRHVIYTYIHMRMYANVTALIGVAVVVGC